MQFRHLCVFVIFQINIPECYNKETKESFKRSNLKARQTGLPNVKESEMKGKETGVVRGVSPVMVFPID